ncbi:MAG: hypothetical protein OXI80_09415 [Caldilineaceae bacterium]|nr:hypothetical protein [Caldilineaceae bacterium]MDE0337873.1 hypothetical protein [Caldilineaceae bacterium]
MAAPPPENRLPEHRLQSESAVASHLLLQPALETSLVLLTHTLDVRVATADGRSLTLQIEASYRLHNEEDEAISATLLVVQPASAVAVGRPLPRNITVTLDGQPLALQSAGQSVGQSVQAGFDADARRRLTLSYELPLTATHTFDFHYPISELDSWPSDISGWRVTIDFAGMDQWLAPSNSWLQISPRGWKMRASQLEWLREERPPTTDVHFQALHPQWIREIQDAQNAVRAQNDLESMQQLGDLYAQLHQAPALRNASRDRFYEQALAAYTQALQLGEERVRPDTVLAAVRYRLAALYRKRAIASDGSVDSVYVALMVAEAEKALPATPQGPARTELQSWVAQGLQQQLRTARLQENWPQALLLTERLARLPADIVDPATLEDERRAILLHEVLQQLQDGNEEAAVKLVGKEFLTEETLPRPEYRTLFANWQITVTVNRNDMVISALARPIFQRRVDAEAALNTLLNSWSTSGAAKAALTLEANGFLIQLDQLDAAKRQLLAQNTPQLPDWALLRSVLLTTEQESQQETQLLWQRTTQAIDVDFRSVGDQWHSMAASLDREAAAVEDEIASATALNRAETAALEIRQSLRAAQHRLEAGRWRRLVSDSTVQVVMGELHGDASPQRVWLLGLTDPPQRLTNHTESISAVRLWLAIALAVVLSTLFAGLLWLLL